MDVTHILDPLNDAQREAVTSDAPSLLVLAGAGSGKTRVLVHRIAWQLSLEQSSPHNILAVTFTNKAAAEMRGRLESMLEMPLGGMWVGTFHGLAHRLLRQHWQDVNLPQTFQILDSEDQYRVIRRIMKGMELDESSWPPKQVQWFINGKKDEGLRAKHMDPHGDHYQEQMLRVYKTYEETCQRSGLVDFAELLLRAHELFLERPDILEHYQNRFKYVLVDEFQDTNSIQYAWIRLLAGGKGKIFVVGDDDQSIYGWRGARIENIHQFSRDFAGTQVVRLEQNYRSTGNILNAANALIANNNDRLGKKLWTNDGEGEPIKLYTAFNEMDEAHYVVDRIKEWSDQGNARKDAAILYRSNAQSRVFEEALMSSGVPYRVYGGLRFFDRAEIKDALAYLRLMENANDDASFERIVNMPTRGIGDRSLTTVREIARLNKITMWNAAVKVIKEQKLSARAVNALSGFMNMIASMKESCAGLELYEQVNVVIETSTLLEHYRKDKSERGEGKVENLEELVNAARGFEMDEEDLQMTQLASFLSHAALEAGEGQADPWEDCVQLMTLHSAKGLEFPLVFICGVEEGLFPHQRSVEEPGRLEEERRLCYVGMTRARQQLYFSYAEQRRLYGNESYPLPSRFLREIPDELIQEVRSVNTRTTESFGPRTTRASSVMQEIPAEGLQLGQRVRHAKFGEGIILNYEGQGGSTRVQVNFEQVGSKWLVIAYANLQSV